MYLDEKAPGFLEVDGSESSDCQNKKWEPALDAGRNSFVRAGIPVWNRGESKRLRLPLTIGTRFAIILTISRI